MKIPPYRRNLLFWVLRNAITGLTLGGYIESIPLIGGVISYQARNYVATGFTTGNRTSIDPFGFGDIATIYDFLRWCIFPSVNYERQAFHQHPGRARTGHAAARRHASMKA